MAGIFISYRRSDTEGYAGRLFEGLRARFGRDMVFFDVAGIEPGQDFHKVVGEKVLSCDIFLALIGNSWASASDEDGQRRLEDPQDFVRLETAAALQDNVPVTFYGLSYSYALSGTWRVKDGRFDYKVETSNIPDFVPTGHTGYVEILGVTAEEFACFDPGDEGTYVDLRVK